MNNVCSYVAVDCSIAFCVLLLLIKLEVNDNTFVATINFTLYIAVCKLFYVKKSCFKANHIAIVNVSHAPPKQIKTVVSQCNDF